MELLYRYVLEERAEIMDNEIRLTAIGELDRLPQFVREPLDQLMADSADNDEMILCLALSYGGREDLAASMRAIARKVQTGEIQPTRVDERMITEHLSTSYLPPVDLLIRTSGEQRVSNFLLWELAYAELLFVDTMWPDFRKPHLLDAIRAYQQRERRFGRLSAAHAAD